MLSILIATLLAQTTADGPAAKFNKHPGPEVFARESKPGLPTSDSLGTLHREYLAQPKVQNVDRVDAERPCSAALVETQQEARPVGGSVAVNDAWFSWLPWGCGAMGIIATVLIWIQWRSQRGA
jgi:hypothetical protein